MQFKQWKRHINEKLVEAFGFSGSDFVDICWRDLYEDCHDSSDHGLQSVIEELEQADELFAEMVAAKEREAAEEREAAAAAPKQKKLTPKQWVISGIRFQNEYACSKAAHHYGDAIVYTNCQILCGAASKGRPVKHPAVLDARGRVSHPRKVSIPVWQILRSKYILGELPAGYHPRCRADFQTDPNYLGILRTEVEGKTVRIVAHYLEQIIAIGGILFVSADQNSPFIVRGEKHWAMCAGWVEVVNDFKG